MRDFDTTISNYTIKWTELDGKTHRHIEYGMEHAVLYARNLLKHGKFNITIIQNRYVENWWED